MSRLRRLLSAGMCAAICAIAVGGSGLALQQAASAETLSGRLVFVTTRFGGVAQIVTARPDGSELKQLTTAPGQNFAPSLSSDGTTILFSSDRENPNKQFQIYSMNVDGSSLRRLTNAPLNAGTPAWSPDDKVIAFAATTPGSSRFDIYTANADGSNQRRQTVATDSSNSSPAFSPNGKEIAYVSSASEKVTLPNGTIVTTPRQQVHILTNFSLDASATSAAPTDQAITMAGNSSYPQYFDPTHLLVTSTSTDGSTAQLYLYDAVDRAIKPYTPAGIYAAEAHVDPVWVTYTTIGPQGVAVAWMPRGGGAQTVLALGPGDNYSGIYRPLIATPASAAPVGGVATDSPRPSLNAFEVMAGVTIVGVAVGGLYYFVKIRKKKDGCDEQRKAVAGAKAEFAAAQKAFDAAEAERDRLLKIRHAAEAELAGYLKDGSGTGAQLERGHAAVDEALAAEGKAQSVLSGPAYHRVASARMNLDVAEHRLAECEGVARSEAAVAAKVAARPWSDVPDLPTTNIKKELPKAPQPDMTRSDFMEQLRARSGTSTPPTPPAPPAPPTPPAPPEPHESRRGPVIGPHERTDENDEPFTKTVKDGFEPQPPRPDEPGAEDDLDRPEIK